MNKCINCDKQLEEANTKPKKFCSDRCRKAYGRDNGQTTKENGQNVENTDIIKDNGQVSATDNVEEVVMKLSTQESPQGLGAKNPNPNDPEPAADGSDSGRASGGQADHDA